MLHVQEEIAHCAAGVRWLTYLHSQACSAVRTHHSLGFAAQLQNTTQRHSLPADKPNVGTSSLHSLCSPNLEPLRKHVHSGAALTALDATAASMQEPMQELCDNGACCDGQRQSAAPECATDSHSKDVTSHSADIYDWQADAQHYSTVEGWFHALVRAYFKGSLKVHCMDYTLTPCWLQLAHTSAVFACIASYMP